MSTGFVLDAKKGLWIYKAPEATLAYTLDLNDAVDPWLAAGETITTATFTCEDGITIDQQTNNTTTATVKLSGGSVGIDYRITLTWTTSAGSTDSRYFTARVRARTAG